MVPARIKICCTIYILLIGIGAECVFSQTLELPGMTNFSKEEYQAQKQNWKGGQLDNGMMCFANTGGLLTFDGVNWLLHEMPHRQIIRSMFIEQDRIYVGSFGEFGYWIPNEIGELEYKSLVHLAKPDQIAGEEIWNILKIDDAIIFHSFGTIFKYELDTLIQIAPPQSIRFIHQIDSNRYALQVTGHGLMRYENDQFFELLPQAQLDGLKVTDMGVHPDNFILVATELNALFKIEDNHLIPWQTSLDSQLYIHQINKLLVLPSSEILIGTISDGLYILDKNGKEQAHINKKSGLQNNTILSITEDPSGNVWLGLDDGITLINFENPTIYYRDFTGKIGTLYDAIIFDQQLYIGTNQGVFRKDYSGKIPAIASEFKLVEGTQGQVWDFVKIDQVLFCGHNNGTYLIENNNARLISEISGGWQLKPIPTQTNRFIQGTYTGLVIFGNGSKGWSEGKSISGFSGAAKQLAFDHSGWLWVANPYRGLHRVSIDFQIDSVIDVQSFDHHNGLPSDYNISLLQLGDQVYFFNTQEYFQYDEETNRFTEARHPWLIEAGSDKIIPDGPDRFFMVQKNQVNCMQFGKSQTSYSLTLVDGAENIVNLVDNRYLACMQDGYAILEPSSDLSATVDKAYPAVSKTTSWDRSGKINLELFNPVLTKDPIKLSHQTNRVEFQFASYDFAQSRRFKFQLEGFDLEWSPWSYANRKEYTNLAPGTYTFRLGYENSSVISIVSLIQLPAWYQTNVAKFLFFFVVVGLGYLLLLFNERRLQTQTRRLEIEKEREINRQRLALQNEMLAREVRHKSQQLANSTMNVIQKNKVLQKLREDIAEVKGGIGTKFPDKEYNRLMHLIQHNMSNDHNWKLFETNFNEVHADFLKTLNNDYPTLTSGDLKLAALLKMNLSSKEIAPLLNISLRGVENKRYRLRQKMSLSPDENLLEILLRY